MYQIGEFSKILKLTVKALRHYEKLGLLKPEHIDKFTGYRYYTTAQLYPMQKIIALKEAGFALEEIRNILSGKNISEMLKVKEAILQQERVRIESQLTRFAAVKKIYLEEQTMDYQVTTKTLPKYVVYYKQFKVKNFGEYSEIVPKIGAEVLAANPKLKCVEPSYCYIEYLDGEYRDSNFMVEYAEAVEKFGEPTGDIKFKELKSQEVACVMHKGSYSQLRKVYTCLVNWIENSGYEICGNAREQYIDGCWNKNSEDEYLTEVQFPITKKC